MSTLKTRIGPLDNGRSMSLDEFRDAEGIPGYRYELAKGVVEVVQVPNDPHRQIVWNLDKLFFRYDLTHPGVILCGGGGGEFQLIVEPMASERHPDAGVVLRGTPPDVPRTLTAQPCRRSGLIWKRRARLRGEKARLPSVRNPRVLDR